MIFILFFGQRTMMFLCFGFGCGEGE